MNSGIVFKNLSKLNVSYISYAFKANQAMRMARFMGKALSGSKKKFKWYPAEKPSNTSIFVNPKGDGKGASRRQVVLERVFMTHITELMTTGIYADEIEKEKISVTKVKVHSDFKGVNIHWYKKSGLADKNTEEFLQKIRKYLSFELTSLQVVGLVPPITFVKDKAMSHASELDELFKIADYPADYEPCKPFNTIKRDLGYYEDVEESEAEEALPEMSQNVLGLNHFKIMNRIQTDIRKRISAHYKSKEGVLPVTQLKVGDMVDFDKKEYAAHMRKKWEERRAIRNEKYKVEDYDEEESDAEDFEEEGDDIEYEDKKYD